MRKKLLPMCLLAWVSICLLVFGTTSLGQFGQGKQGKKGGGGPGNFGGPGNQGGGGGGPGGKMAQFMADPDKAFEMLSRGQGFVLLSNMKMLRDPMQEWANANGVTSGQLSR